MDDAARPGADRGVREPRGADRARARGRGVTPRRASGTISVVIPCWNEAKVIEAAIAAARALADEVIVADAASPDGTAALATRAGALVIQAPRGRGAQL
ncbi:MAG: glycosyltransferase, partial [Myxococcota bacterium]|nr:glycosyltransferase [Myxococcota bacterium]